MSIGINVEHHVAHTHTQNGLAKSFIKRLQMIARLLLMKTKLLQYILSYEHNFLITQLRKFILDNASEFTSKAFDDCCMSIGINVEHHVAHTHTQNGLAKSFIKRLQMIARLLLMKTKLLQYILINQNLNLNLIKTIIHTVFKFKFYKL
jgi:hypothetical protein